MISTHHPKSREKGLLSLTLIQKSLIAHIQHNVARKRRKRMEMVERGKRNGLSRWTKKFCKKSHQDGNGEKSPTYRCSSSRKSTVTLSKEGSSRTWEGNSAFYLKGFSPAGLPRKSTSLTGLIVWSWAKQGLRSWLREARSAARKPTSLSIVSHILFLPAGVTVGERRGANSRSTSCCLNFSLEPV